MRKFLVAASLILTSLLLTPATNQAIELGVPSVAVGAVTVQGPNSTCGTEVSAITVNWTVSLSKGTTVDSFKVSFKGTFPNAATAPFSETKTAAGSARSQVFCVFNGHLLSGYTVGIETTVKSTSTVSKSGTF